MPPPVLSAPTAAAELPLFLTVNEIAKIMKLSPMMIYQYIGAKRGPRTIRFGRKIRVRREDFLNWSNGDHPSPKKKD